jgi:protein involved in polysaccharide export with SLBB domain
MSADASSSSFVSLRRRSLFVAMFALAACESDPTPIVNENANGDGSLNLAPTNGSGARGGPGIGGKDPDYRLGANDRVRIIVFGQPTLTGEYTLDGNGVLAFPLIGNVNAQGQTTSQVQQAIASRLDPDFLRNPSVSAEVITRRPFYVIGEVQKPGNYPYVTDMTALQAIAMAGGYTYRARQNNLYLKRLDANGRMVRVAATPETRVKPGDTVEVKERYF